MFLEGHTRKMPEELKEYLYREKFKMSPLEYDRTPSDRIDTDLLIMNLIREHGE